MKKCLLCDHEPVPDHIATCENDGEATWAAVDMPAEDPVAESADAPKRRSRK